MRIVFCIDPWHLTACTTNVMRRAMIAVTTSDSKYSRSTPRGGPARPRSSGALASGLPLRLRAEFA